jgi:hypothetical protein
MSYFFVLSPSSTSLRMASERLFKLEKQAARRGGGITATGVTRAK